MERNFVLLMEARTSSSASPFTRENLYLMCLDPESEEALHRSGVRCVPTRITKSLRLLWVLRVKVLRCILEEGYDVIVSDADALWLSNPLMFLEERGLLEGSDVIAQRGSFPPVIGRRWGVTMQMGFAVFRARTEDMAMKDFLIRVYMAALGYGDDQVRGTPCRSSRGIHHRHLFFSNILALSLIILSLSRDTYRGIFFV